MQRVVLIAIIFVFILLGSLGWARSAVCGPWSPESGRGYAKVWTKMLLAQRYIDHRGTTTPIRGYREVFVSTFGEVGVGADLALLWQWDLVRVLDVDDVDRHETGVFAGDPEAGLRWSALTFGPLMLGFEGALRAPIAPDRVIANVAAADGRAIAEARAGSGVWEARATASFGGAWSWLWFAASASYVVRTHGFDHELRWSAEAGRSIWIIGAKLQLSGSHALAFTGSAEAQEVASGRGNGASHTGAALELFVSPWDGGAIGVTSEVSLFGLGLEGQSRGLVLSLFVSTRF